MKKYNLGKSENVIYFISIWRKIQHEIEKHISSARDRDYVGDKQ